MTLQGLALLLGPSFFITPLSLAHFSPVSPLCQMCRHLTAYALLLSSAWNTLPFVCVWGGNNILFF